MLAKQQRLSREAFTQYFKIGKRFQSAYATLIIASSTEFHGSVVVSKKVSKKAVVRNTLRRRVYAQLYKLNKKEIRGVYILVLKPAVMSLSRSKQHEAIVDVIEQGVKSTYNTSHV